MVRVHEDERCAASVVRGGRGYVAQRCRQRAIVGDPDRLCQIHRVEQDGYGHPNVEPEAEQTWAAERDLESRLTVVTDHLREYFGLNTALDYDRANPRVRPTGRLVVDVDDLLRILDAEDLMPRRSF
ncbi:MAG: hypothetical protein ACQSGP_23960 [Frankia sp.]